MFNTSTTTKGASNLLSNIAKNAAQTTTALANTTTKAVNSVAEAATDTFQSANIAMNKGLNVMANTAKNIPIVNSLLPFGNAKNTTTFANATKNAANAAVAAANSAFENVFPNSKASTAWPWWVWAAAVFLVVVIIVATVMTVYKEEVKATWDKMLTAIGLGPKEVKPAPQAPVATELATPEVPGESGAPSTSLLGEAGGLISKLLPTSQKQVFNVSTNDFTYYDAEPMCRALGAQLATYDQVQEAWKKGADWCNYGWVKGQVAVYPTQESTYAMLQAGPPEDQTACGVPGVNGGFFDNPEMRFGVNCYGVKPAQTANDERLLQEKGVLPLTTSAIKVEQQAQEYKDRLASIGVLPFNGSSWSV